MEVGGLHAHSLKQAGILFVLGVIIGVIVVGVDTLVIAPGEQYVGLQATAA